MNPTHWRRALMCMAIGDAIGSPFEFQSPTSAEVRHFIHSHPCDLRFTDDTQMTLAGLVGLTHPDPFAGVCDLYLDWYRGQAYLPTQNPLFRFACMTAREAPGMTVMGSLGAHVRGATPQNESNGCGTVMRQLAFAFHAEHVGWHAATDLALKAAFYTHAGVEIEPATRDFMRAARYPDALAQNFPDIVAAPSAESLGHGFSAASCLAIAIWSVANATDFEDMLIRSIAHPGDSDSTAAVAGGMWGLGTRASDSQEESLVAVVRQDCVDSIGFALETYTGH